MSLREALEFAVRGEEVAAELLEAAFGEIMDGKASEAAIAGLLIALRTKGETVGEIVATARALRARADTAPLARADAIDTCGTGGDGAGTFNVSTAAAFVVAGAGVPVAKHGNRAASSRSGSADVLEALGVRVDLPIAEAARVLDDVGIAFFFARRAHPAMRFVAPVRQELGVRTLMNCLGPLLNPVGVRRQSERALVVHGSDGLDELTTTGPSWAAHWRKGAVESLEIDPQALGIALAAPEALRGGDAAQNAGILRRVLDGSEGPERDLVLLNAAAALWVADAAGDLREGLVRAGESVDSGAARERLAALVRASAEVGDAS
jgi:anthranilate phosphoribosyltransferase